jgi:hypothetical protein
MVSAGTLSEDSAASTKPGGFPPKFRSINFQRRFIAQPLFLFRFSAPSLPAFSNKASSG